MKPVLDACCGSKMFWFDKADPRAIFCDKRNETAIVSDSSSKTGKRTIKISPDMIADFTDLPFPNNHFQLVVFDPPHLVKLGASSWLAKKYGRLTGDWRAEIRRGFAECFRVLNTGGTLIFKWSEKDIPLREILELTPEKPLFGHKSGKANNTHWITFLKQ